MNFFNFEFFFGLLVCLSFLLTFYIYLRLLIGVIRKREVPQWIYKFGQAFQGRVHVEYENATTSAALRDANLFLFLWLLVNVLTFAFLYHKNGDALAALYQCMKMPFATIIVALIVHPILLLLRMHFSSSEDAYHIYSTTNAVRGAAFFPSSFWLFTSICRISVQARETLRSLK